MREILFRGKKLSNGEWVQGHYFETITKHIHHNIVVPDSMAVLGYINYEVDIQTVSEYTGLNDLNGIPIFEGDIIKHYNKIEYGHSSSFDVGLVYWDEEELGWKRTGQSESQYIKNHGYILTNKSKYEVIGNIYDNPDLISSISITNMPTEEVSLYENKMPNN